MLWNHLTVAWRSLVRRKLHALINVVGLSLAIALCVLSAVLVQHEWSYDRFHTSARRIYRVYSERTDAGGTHVRVEQPTALGPLLAEGHPAVREAVRLWPSAPLLVRVGERLLEETGAVYGDPGVLEVFSFPRLAGDPVQALGSGDGVVLSREAARRYFGPGEALGQPLSVRGPGWEGEFLVGGVVDVPPNSSIRFALFMGPQRPVGAPQAALWNYSSAATHLLLEGSARPDAVEAELSALAAPYWEQVRVTPPRLRLQPLLDIHLDSQVPAPPGQPAPGSGRQPLVLSLISLAVLLIASANYTMLSLGMVSSRCREAAVRRVLGSTRGQLLRQHCAEAVLVVGAASVVGLAVAEAALPAFGGLVDRSVAVQPGAVWLVVVTLVLTVGLAAGGYPALLLSHREPTRLLRGREPWLGASWLARGLIVLQFAVSAGLIDVALIMARQMGYVTRQGMGYDATNVITVHLGYRLEDAERRTVYEAYRAALEGYPGVVGMAAANSALDGAWTEFPSYAGDGWQLRFHRLRTDGRLLRLLGIQVVEGRDLVAGLDVAEGPSCLVNEALVRELGRGNLLGQALPFDNLTVVGVVRDFHLQSLHHPVAPAVILCSGFGHIFVKADPGGRAVVLDRLRSTWQQVLPHEPFGYSFLEDDVARQYAPDRQWEWIVQRGAALAILIACLGAFGMTALTVARRTGEIGIRKVLGASVEGVVWLLSREFAWLVFVGSALACPVAYWAAQRWLQGFAYRGDLGPGSLAVGGAVTLLLVVLAVGLQSARAALANPVDALRSE
ncbi:MAG: ABC transporter permease [Candidatus Latescibacterota bacterium]